MILSSADCIKKPRAAKELRLDAVVQRGEINCDIYPLNADIALLAIYKARVKKFIIY
jgi:hypothetical protein